jgi:hydroxyethylthiazole kinase-like uncharacterized protein yjeF
MLPPLTGPVLTAAEMRAAEAHAMANGISVDTLMARAGLALAEAVWRFGGGRPVLILCGPGNNGGDGYVAARILRDRGLSARVAALAPPQTDVARRAAAQWAGDVQSLADADPAPVLLDCLFGTGLTRPLDTVVADRLAALATAARCIIAADLPSGVGSDDGACLGASPAQVTLALGTLKPAHVLQPAAALCGYVMCADIGLAPTTSLAHVIARPCLPQPGPQDHKYRRGLVTVVAGAMPGAAKLCAAAAARSGAGYVVLAGAQDEGGLPLSIVHRDYEAARNDPRVSALVIGPGLGRGETARALLNDALARDVPLVLDADALHLVDQAALSRRQAPTLLTPHDGEFAALVGAGTGSKIDRTRQAAQNLGCTLIFKGADSVVASPDGRVGVSAGASAWLATAGTGDVLAGIAATLLAQGMDVHAAAEAALWLHARAAQIAGAGLIADDLLAALPKARGQAR